MVTGIHPCRDGSYAVVSNHVDTAHTIVASSDADVEKL